MGLALPEDFRDLRDSRKGETAWVIGSGASLDFIQPDFFADKFCVAVNYVGTTLGLSEFYAVTHYHLDAIAIAAMRPDVPIFTPESDQGGTNLAPRPPTEPNIYRVPTKEQQYGAFTVERDWPTEPDNFVVGPTSLHMTMHVAAWLGAAHLILVGADCGTIDDRANFAAYDDGSDNPLPVWATTLPRVADRLRADGVTVHSLNPWVNFGLEGHRYSSPLHSVN